jgi:hypothetical protein
MRVGLTFALQALVAYAACVLLVTAGCSSSSDNGSGGGADSSTADNNVPFETGGGDHTVGETGSSSGVAEGGPTGETGGPCTGGKIECSGTCVDVSSDNNNCGNCNAKCGTGLVCSKGACSLICGSGTTQCGTGCYDLQTDSNNCGACGTKCNGTQVCSAGQCQTACGPGSTLCGQSCVNTSSDNANCGSCGKVCSAGTVCGSGSCSISCPSGETACTSGGSGDAGAGAGVCTNLQTDVTNCGQCNNKCPSGFVCNVGTCAVTCQTGLVNCGGQCIDPKTNANFCGASGACGTGDAGGSKGSVCSGGKTCNNGSCSLVCGPGTVNCGGACIDPNTSNTNCGATGACGVGGGSAGKACTGGTPVCSGGTCSATCGSSQVKCDGACVDPQTNAGYCGATLNSDCTGQNRGVVCANGQVCSGGQCQITCQTGFVNCAGTCIDPLTNRTYCGASVQCGNGDQGQTCDAGYVCNNGACQISCSGSYIACPDPANTGKQVCVDPNVNPTYCGAAGACTSPNNAASLNPPNAPSWADPTNKEGQDCNLSTGYVCNSGVCSLSCPVATPLKCGTQCVDPTQDPVHCGAAGSCSANTAAPTPVYPPLAQPEASGIDSQSAGFACGAAGQSNGFGTGYTCVSSQCELKCGPAPSNGAPEIICNLGGANPNSGTPTCIDPQTSPTNCGASAGCGTSLGAPLSQGHNCVGEHGAGWQCVSGACKLVCPGSEIECDQTGTPSNASVTPVCIDPTTSNSNCGASGTCAGGTQGSDCTAAPLQTCGAVAVAGGGTTYKCVSSCAGTDQCPSSGSPYCANWTSDQNDCGGCSYNVSGDSHICTALTTCGNIPGTDPTVHANYACRGTCPNYYQADGVTRNAAEMICGPATGAGPNPTSTSYCADTNTDTNNCGGCGTSNTSSSPGSKVCPAGQICSGGTCGASCTGVYTYCPTPTAHCADLDRSNQDCGGCGTPCAGQCISGLCCTAGEQVCSGACTNTNNGTFNAGTSVYDNCGACGNSCTTGQVCSHGLCGTFHWTELDTDACDANCQFSGGAGGFNCVSTGSVTCNSSSVGAWLWMYQGSPSNPQSMGFPGAYGWVASFCGKTGCHAYPGDTQAVTCTSSGSETSTVWQCTFP